MTKKQIRLNLVYIEDSLFIDKDMLQSIKMTIQDDYPKQKINTKTLSLMGSASGIRLEKLQKAIQMADVVVFDYGGLYQAALMGGGHAAIDYWNRFFIKMIENNSSKDWRCISAVDTFDTIDRQELEDLGVRFEW